MLIKFADRSSMNHPLLLLNHYLFAKRTQGFSVIGISVRQLLSLELSEVYLHQNRLAIKPMYRLIY